MKSLLVEDDPALRELVQRVMTGNGHDVTACADAETAWELCQREVFPLMVLDWRLPGMDGLELCRRVRTLPTGEQSVVLLMTARDRPEDLAAVLDAGADDYLAKPFNFQLLEVRLAVAERQARTLAARAVAEREREEATRRLQTLVWSGTEAQTASDDTGVFQAIGAAIVRVGLNAHISTLQRREGGDRETLVIRHLVLTDAALPAVERWIGSRIVGRRLDVDGVEPYYAAIREGRVVLVEDAADWVREALPWLDRPAARALGRLREAGRAICAPITDGREALGALSVWGTTLSEADLPAIELLGRQAGGALAAQRLRLAERERHRLDGALLVARTAAHEINNALGLTVGYAEILANHPTIKADPALGASARELQEGAQRAADRVSRLQRVIRLEEVPSPLGADRPVLDIERSTAPSEA